MREIKFRVFDKKNKVMLYPTITWNYSDESSNYMLPVFSGIKYDDIDNVSELMQYTGIKDKNGKEIFEGDVIEVTHYYYDKRAKDNIGERHRPLRVIKWKSNHFATGFNLSPFPRKNTSYEVVGSIYENPELINNHD